MAEDNFPFVDYENLYSAIMFWAHDNTPMSFVLSTRNFKYDVQLRKIIEHCGGRTEKNVKSATPYSAVLVDDDALVWSHKGDVFKLSYIKACCNAQKCLNISPFRLNKTSTILKEGFDYMKIIYYKKYSWDTIPGKYALERKADNSDGGDDDNDGEEEGENDNAADDYFPSIDDNSRDREYNNNSSTDSDGEKKRRKTRKNRPNKHTRVSYTKVEKEAILRYIINRNEYDRVRGRIMWQEMEKRETCPNRTWQSMKEHFLKTLVIQLDCFDFITPEIKRRLISNI